MTLIESIERFMPWRAFNFSTDISLRHRYVYLEVPKAACSTVRKRLIAQETATLGLQPQRVHPPVFESCFVKPFQLAPDFLEHVLFSGEFFRFSFVREPRARFLSAYLEKIRQRKPQLRQALRRLGLPSDDLEASPALSFERFIDAVEATPPLRRDKHWREQRLLLLDGWLEFDLLGRVERFEDDWQEVARRSNLAPAEPDNALWHAVGAADQLDEHYTDTLRRRVERIYAGDFKRFGYPL